MHFSLIKNLRIETDPIVFELAPDLGAANESLRGETRAERCRI